ncbi:hypothetical protein DP113_31780 [Brasilonema octagenarum UFV-E1]|nr:hypothetical protein DP113_31780 [Brasilonema octagenarum UFV-E1]
MHASPLARGEPDSQSPQRSKLAAWVASPGRLWGNPNARSLCRETLLQDWLRKALLWARGWLHNALNPTPFGFASRLGRETLLQRWSHQIPLSGNPHQVLAPQGTTLGSTGSATHWLSLLRRGDGGEVLFSLSSCPLKIPSTCLAEEKIAVARLVQQALLK